MEHECIKRAKEFPFTQNGLLDFSNLLPDADEALNALLAEAVAGRHHDSFTKLILAALGAGRKVDAAHLVEGIILLPDTKQLAAVVMHCSGDVAGALVQAVAGDKLTGEWKVTALLLAGIWCERNRITPIPPSLILQAKVSARTYFHNPIFLSTPERAFLRLHLYALANVLREDTLKEIIGLSDESDSDPFLEGFEKSLLQPIEPSALGHVPEHAEPLQHSGYTLRRAVPRIGRNDSCPCGSGKKYKKCCIEKDRLRMQESSSVAGLTMDELREQREQHLTKKMISEMKSFELVKLDPLKVEASLLPVLLSRLHFYKEFEASVRVFELLGVNENLENHWDEAIFYVTQNRNKELLARLLKLADYEETVQMPLPLSAKLLVMDSDACPELDMIEAMALKGLKQTDDSEQYGVVVDLAFSLLESSYPALGVLITRGVLPVSNLLDAETLLENMLTTRDRLSLAPVDPFEDILDIRFSQDARDRHDPGKNPEVLRKLEQKDHQLVKLRQEVGELHAEIKRKESAIKREKNADPSDLSSKPVSSSPNESTIIQDLRHRSQVLKSELKDRHQERNQLRRELESTLQDLEDMRRQSREKAEENAQEPRKAVPIDDFADTSFDANQPARIPIFDKRFSEGITSIPQPTVRKAMVLVGRLAAGQEGAFKGVKRLKSEREIYRQKVGADHRLLFRMTGTEIEVIALINRRDLDRQIQSLIAS